MITLAAFLVTVVLFTVFVAWVYGEKQRTRLAPDKYGFRAPQFLVFERASGQGFAAIGVILYGLILLGVLAWTALT